ncbi:hypothetical protein [Tomitella biformata]|nr:hypothetical protein [Tomitella biformata]
MEFPDKRWTLLVVRELLAKRLRNLERARIVRRAIDGLGRSSSPQ